MQVETLVVTNSASSSETIITNANISGKYCLAKQSQFVSDIQVIEDKNGKVIISPTKGIGINRNIALLYSDPNTNICVLSDDDMYFYGNYIDKVIDAYNHIPKADVIIFNIDGTKRYKNSKIKRINKLNYMRYGASRITFKKNRILNYTIFFNTLYGASKYGSGEDTLFLKDCLDKGLNVYVYPVSLAKIVSEESSWFSGFDEKYIFDKAALFYTLNNNFYWFLIIRFLLKNRKKWEKKYTLKKVLEISKDGANSVKTL